MRRSRTSVVKAWSLVGLGVGAMVSFGTSVARADSGLDSPESGVVQMGRGSAWVARADDPLAAYFNPAAMAFQATGVHLGGQLIFKSTCFTRLGPNGQPVAPDTGIPAPLYPGMTQPSVGMQVLPSARVCADTPPFPNPQIGAVFRVHKQVAIGFALVAPHSAGKSTWPTSLPYTNKFGQPSSEPAPNRYLLTDSNALLVFPTFSIAYAPLDNLSFGAGFTWGIGTADFGNFAEAVSTQPAAGMMATDHSANDVQTHLTAKDLFIPGIVLGALWMPTSNFDVAGWFKWSDALKASADLTLTSEYFNANGTPNTTPCTAAMGANCNVTTANNAGSIKVNIPMEARLGFRFHQPRAEVTEQPSWATNPEHPDRKVRDPLSQDLFDIELNFTYSNNSSFQAIQLQFNPGITIADGTPGGVGQVPQNGNIPHMWKDVVGVRLGSDVNVIPNRLALRAGGWVETAGVDAQYLNLDFDEAMKGGVAGGATLRLGPIDTSIGYQHTFYATLNNNGNGAVNALAGSGAACASPSSPVGPGCYRSYQAVNGGRLTQNLNEVGLSGTLHW